MVLFHIDRGQKRSDLVTNASLTEINKLRYEKAGNSLKAGLSVGMQAIGYGRSLEDIEDVVEFVSQTKGVSHLLITNYTCVNKFERISGSIEKGLSAEVNINHEDDDELSNDQVQLLMEKNGCSPFAYVAAQHDLKQKRWLSYQISSITSQGKTRCYPMTSSLLERFGLFLSYWLRGGYLFFFKPSIAVLRVQLLVNGLTGGNFRNNFTALFRSLNPSSQIESKHLVFQQGPGIQDGKLVYCRECPDATLKGGRLVPLCLTDKVIK